MTTQTCEGSCETHQGEAKKVLVKDKFGTTPRYWRFFYCETAIEEDKRRGFEVKIIDPDEQARLSRKSEWEPLDKDELEYLNA